MHEVRRGAKQMGRRLAVVAAVVLIAAPVAGCGSSGTTTVASTNTTPGTATSGTGESSTEIWATGVCSAITTWKASIKAASRSVTSKPSTAGLRTAAGGAEAANQKLTTDLTSVGRPDTAAGQQAQSSLNQLSANLGKDVNTIQNVLSGASGIKGVLNAASVVSSTLAAMGTQVSSTVSDLQSLSGDANGEIKTAFAQSSACSSLTK